MELGSFYGLTAPNIVLLFNAYTESLVGTKNDLGEVLTKESAFNESKKMIQDLVTLLNNNADRERIKDSYSELVYFRESLNQLPTTFEIEVDKSILEQYSGACTKGGIVSNYDGDTEYFFTNLKSYMMRKIMKNLSDSQYVNIEFFAGLDDTGIRNKIKDVVESFISDERFNIQIDTIDTFIDSRVMRGMVTDKPLRGRAPANLAPTDGNLMSEFKAKLARLSMQNPKLKNKLEFANGEVVEFNENEMKILEYFRANSNIIDLLISLMTIGHPESKTVFGKTVFDIALTNPLNLYTIVDARFPTDLNNAEEISNMVSTCKQEMKKLDVLFAEEIRQSSSSSVTSVGVTFESANQACLDAEKKHKYITPLRQCLKVDLDTSKFYKKDFNKLVEFSYSIDLLNIENISRLIGLSSFNENNWNRFIEKANSCYLFGFNLYSEQLFIESIKGTTFDQITTCIMDDKKYETYQEVIKEVNAFLNSIKPMGESLQGGNL